MTTTNIHIRAFWEWFVDHQSQFKTLSSPDEPFWDLAVEQLKKVDCRLWIELSHSSDAPREFIVTDEGHIEAFPVAEALVDQAPDVEGWAFIALKSPMGFDFTTRCEDTLFEPRLMWFLPLESSSRPQDLGIRVGIQGLDSMNKTNASNAVLVILDTALGEQAAALDIQHVEVTELPPNPESLGYIELPELPDYIAWRKRPLNHRST